MKTEEKKIQAPARRITDAEMGTIKSHFAENFPLLVILRKVFLQFPLSLEEKAELTKRFSGNAELLAVVEKTFLPQIDPNAPVTQVVDLLMTVNVTEKSPEQALPLIAARKLVIDYLRQGLNDLAGKETKKRLQFSDLSDVDEATAFETFVKIHARNTIIGHVESQLQFLSFLAGLISETVEQTQARLSRDSSK